MEKFYDHFIGGKSVSPRDKSDYQAIKAWLGSPVQIHIAAAPTAMSLRQLLPAAWRHQRGPSWTR